MPGKGSRGRFLTDLKVNYFKALIGAGFKHIDAVSFVSPNAVPQMADSEEVLKELDPPDDVEIIGIVVNEKGAQRAIKTEAVRTLGFPYSISPTFLQNNQSQTLEDAIDELEKIEKKADEAGLRHRRLHLDGVRQSLRRSVERRGGGRSRRPARGAGHSAPFLWPTLSVSPPPEKIARSGSAVMAKYDYLEIGVHLHSRPDEAADENSGCLRCRMPPLRLRHRRSGRLPVCAG